MAGWTRRGAGALVGAVLAMALAGCTTAGDLAIMNDGTSDVVVVGTGDDDVTLSGGEGIVLLGYGCTPGDVTVEFASGHRVLLSGPVCPDQQIAIRDDTATLEPAT